MTTGKIVWNAVWRGTLWGTIGGTIGVLVARTGVTTGFVGTFIAMTLGYMGGLLFGSLTRWSFSRFQDKNTTWYRLCIGLASLLPCIVVLIFFICSAWGWASLLYGLSTTNRDTRPEIFMTFFVPALGYALPFILGMILSGQLFAGWYINEMKKQNAPSNANRTENVR